MGRKGGGMSGGEGEEEGNTRGWQREGWGRGVMGRGRDELGRKGGAERDEGGIEERKIYRICANI